MPSIVVDKKDANVFDIDLSLKGKTLTLSLLFKIEIELDDLLLPYKIDLSIYHKIENSDLINHIKRVGIIGSGTMGSGIAQVAATAGCHVRLYDTNIEALDKAKLSLEKIDKST